MIYQLMKRDPAWRAAPYLVIASAVLWPLHSSDPSGVVPFTVLNIIYATCIMLFRAHERCTLFTAALPIGGRQIYLARTLSLATFIWLPILAAVTVSWRDTIVLIEAGALASVVVLLIQSVRVREISAPPWLTMASAFSLLMASFLEIFVSPRVTLTTCATVGAILFLKAWTGIPKSFQVAPIEATSQRLEGAWPALPVAVWWPAFRSLFTWQFFSVAVGLLVFPMQQGAIFATIWVNIALQQSRPGLHWLLSLPVSRSKLLLAALIPPLALLMAGYAIGIHFERAPQPLRMRIVTIALALVIAFLQVFVIHLMFWRRLLGVPRTVLKILAVFFPLPIFALFIIDMLRDPKGSLTSAALIGIASILPDNLWTLTALAVALAGAAYWAVDKQFRELEVSEWRQRTKYV